MYRLARKSELPEILKKSLVQYPKKCWASKQRESAALDSPQACIALILGSNQDGEDFFLLTKRSQNLNSHAGQVALPGGLKEETDGNDLLVTLKREVFEEIGIAPAAIDWCTDSWDSMMSLHKIEVHPFLGFLKNSLESHASLQLNPGEVQEAEWIPLRQLFDESLWEFRSYPDAFTSHGFRMPVWKGWRWETWGLTAAVLNIFVSRISGRSPY